MRIYIDEAGRGPLAGPVMVGLVAHEVSDFFVDFRDSKQLTHHQRADLYHYLQKICDTRSSGSASAGEIDAHGIVRAIRTAILRGLWKLFGTGRYTLSTLKKHISSQNIVLVIDGNTDFGLRKVLGVEVETIIKGDALVPQISAASIIAKVERDEWMDRQALKYPEYGFEKHKGYGTLVHRNAIITKGLTPLHRKTFLKNILQS